MIILFFKNVFHFCNKPTVMRFKFTLATFVSISLLLTSCFDFGRKIEGNGNVVTETRKVNKTSKIKLSGGLDVVLEKGPANIRVEADENLQQYIMTEEDNGWIEVKTKSRVNLKSSTPIRVYITTPEITALSVSGSGDIISANLFNADNKVTISIKGSGDIRMGLHAPSIEADIKGSGDIELTGETRDVEVDIKGSGNFNGSELKAENADITIAGSGDAYVYADVNLKVKIAGSGGIKYRGNAEVDKTIAGSGSITKVQ
jgi:hypothetical protein